MDSSPQRQRISFYISAENIQETLVEINAEVKGLLYLSVDCEIFVRDNKYTTKLVSEYVMICNLHLLG
jgi:hypothetical protein